MVQFGQFLCVFEALFGAVWITNCKFVKPKVFFLEKYCYLALLQMLIIECNPLIISF